MSEIVAFPGVKRATPYDRPDGGAREAVQHYFDRGYVSENLSQAEELLTFLYVHGYWIVPLPPGADGSA